MSGRDTPNQRKRRASRVRNGMAALECAPHRKILTRKNTLNTILYGRKRRKIRNQQSSFGTLCSIPWDEEGTKQNVSLPAQTFHG